MIDMSYGVVVVTPCGRVVHGVWCLVITTTLSSMFVLSLLYTLHPSLYDRVVPHHTTLPHLSYTCPLLCSLRVRLLHATFVDYFLLFVGVCIVSTCRCGLLCGLL